MSKKEIDDVILLGEDVLIKFPESSDKTEGGLYVPDSMKNKRDNVWGTIIKTGRDVSNGIEVGDKVYLAGFRVGEVEFDNEFFGLAKSTEIHMIKKP